MTLFSTESGGYEPKLVEAGKKKVQFLKDKGLITDGMELETETLLDICRTLATEKKGYAKAPLYQALRDQLALLPVAAEADGWDTWVNVLNGLAGKPTMTAPRWSTVATSDAVHELEAIKAVAAMFGTPLLGWQEHVARIATERVDGRYRYRTVLITVPRQAGKTTLLRCLFTARALMSTRGIWMTAQTGKDATARWKDLIKAVRKSPLGEFCEVRLSAGSAGLAFPRNDSAIAPFAPTQESLHGYTLTDACVDEAFAFSEVEGIDLEGAISPAQITIDDSQLFIISTKGNPESEWLNKWIAKGRAAISDPDSDIAYFEWSADPSLDPYAPEAIDFHPALGHTISREKLLAEAAKAPATEWRRAYLNLESDAMSEPLIPADVYAACHRVDQPPPLPSQVVGLAYEVAHDESCAALVAAWLDADGETAHVRVVAEAPGTVWLPEAIRQARDAIPGAVLAADDGGPTRQVTDALRRDGWQVETMTSRDYSTGCGRYVARAKLGTLTHDGTESLTTGAAIAATRTVGDSWVVSRRHSPAPIASTVAAIVALRIVDQLPMEADYSADFA